MQHSNLMHASVNHFIVIYKTLSAKRTAKITKLDRTNNVSLKNCI